MSTGVRLTITDGVGLVELDGAERLNAFSRRTGRELSEAYRACDADDEVRVVVLTGSGRAFCAGADLRADAGTLDRPDDSFSASPITPAAWQVRKLVIAAVNGHAIGIGLTIALQCDLRYVAAEATMSVPQVRRGMVGDAGSHWTLTRLAGRGAAADLLLTGRSITGAEAGEWGLANRVLPATDVLPAALATAREVAEQASPAAVALSKSILWSDAPVERITAAETDAHHLLMGHPDVAEGARAWQEKRLPRWEYPVSALPGGLPSLP